MARFYFVRHITMVFLNVAVPMATLMTTSHWANSMTSLASGPARTSITPETGDEYMIDMNYYEEEDLDAAAAAADGMT